MRIRVEDTNTEFTAAAEQIATVLEVQEASRFYPNRGASTLGRSYLTVAAPAPGSPIQARAERTHPPQQLPTGDRKEIR